MQIHKGTHTHRAEVRGVIGINNMDLITFHNIVLPYSSLTNGLILEVNAHSAGDGIRDDQGWGCQVVGTSAGVHTPLKITVARQNSSRHQVALHTGEGSVCVWVCVRLG